MFNIELIKWELRTRFKERICSNIILKRMPEKVVLWMYIIYVILTFCAPEVVTYMFGNDLEKVKFKDFIFIIVFGMFLTIMYRTLKMKINTIINDGGMDFYLIHSNLSEITIRQGVILTEVIWEIPENYFFIATILEVFLTKNISIIVRFLLALIVTIFISFVNYVLLCKKFSARNEKNKKLVEVLKYMVIIFSLVIGCGLGEFIADVPLEFDKGESEKFYNWLYSFNIINCVNSILDNKLILVRIIFAMVLLSIAKQIWNKKLFIKNSVYGTKSDTGFFDKIDFFALIIVGIFMGVLMSVGITYNKVSVMIGYIVISNSVFLISSNVLEMEDCYSMDFEREKMLIWENKFPKLYGYKKKLYVINENIPVILTYAVMYISAIRNINDMLLIVHFLSIIGGLMNMAYIEKNYAVVSNPISIRKDYDSMKNDYSRKMEESSTDLSTFVISLILVMGVILFACGEISLVMMIIIQVITTLMFIGFIFYRERNIIKIIKNTSYLQALYDQGGEE